MNINQEVRSGNRIQTITVSFLGVFATGLFVISLYMGAQYGEALPGLHEIQVKLCSWNN